MRILAIAATLPGIWWLALSLLVVRDHVRRARSPRPKRVVPPEAMRPVKRWPPWRDYAKRPTLFFIVPWGFVLCGVVLLLIWPCFPIHRAFRPYLFTPPNDKVA